MSRLNDYEARVVFNLQSGIKLKSIDELVYDSLEDKPKKKEDIDRDVCRKMMYPTSDIDKDFQGGIENRLAKLERKGKARHDSFGFWSKM